MARPRSAYTPEFKLRAVKMITDQALSVAEAARRLDVGGNLLREWRKAHLARGDAAFPGHGNPAPADDERRRLRAEVTRLQAERDLLTTAAAYFASPPSGRTGSWPTTPTSGRSDGCARPWRYRPPGTASAYQTLCKVSTSSRNCVFMRHLSILPRMLSLIG